MTGVRFRGRFRGRCSRCVETGWPHARSARHSCHRNTPPQSPQWSYPQPWKSIPCGRHIDHRSPHKHPKIRRCGLLSLHLLFSWYAAPRRHWHRWPILMITFYLNDRKPLKKYGNYDKIPRMASGTVVVFSLCWGIDGMPISQCHTNISLCLLNIGIEVATFQFDQKGCFQHYEKSQPTIQ